MDDERDVQLKEKFPDLVVGNSEAVRASEVVCSQDSFAPDATVKVGSYKLVELIAHGSCGDVLRASDENGAQVAIKLFRKELLSNADALQRFHLETKMLRRISHPNVVAILASGEAADGSPYIVMELIDGRTIKAILESDGVFEPKQAAAIGREVCRALVAAHAETVIHRDLKPSNIMITSRKEAKLIDFGIAKAIGYSGETLTQLGGIVGTPAYMSPEQCLGGLVDARSDIYSLGCTLFEMLTGSQAFESSNLVETIAKQLHPDRTTIKSRLKATGAPSALQAIVLKCLEREPLNRYATVSQLDHDLGAFILGTPLRFAKIKANQKLLTALAATAVLLTLTCCLLGQSPAPAPPVSAVPALIPLPSPAPPTIIVRHGPGVHIRSRLTHRPIFSDPGAADLKEALVDASKQRVSLSHADLHDAKLRQVRIDNLDLRDADFRGADLTQATFMNSELNGADLSRATMLQCKFNSTDLTNAKMQNANLSQCRLSSDDNCSGVNFFQSNLGQAVFDLGNVKNADFTRANLTQTSFKHAHCENAIFRGADMTQTSMQYAECSSAQFDGAKLSQTFFEYTNLANASFRNCYPSQVRANYAVLLGTGMRTEERGYLTNQPP